MKKLITMISAAFAALMLPSCLETTTTINVNKDGTGTIRQKIVISGEIAQMANKPDEAAGHFKDEAAKFGEGVTFVGVKKLDLSDDKFGLQVDFKFDDINKLSIDPNTGMNMGGQGQPKAESVTPFTFKLEKDTLTVTNNAAKIVEKAEEEADDIAKQLADGMNPLNPDGMMFKKFKEEGAAKGVKISLVMNFPGGIAETNASNSKDNQVTLAEMDFERIMNQEDKLRKLNKLKANQTKERGELIKEIDGLHTETASEFTVKLK